MPQSPRGRVAATPAPEEPADMIGVVTGNEAEISSAFTDVAALRPALRERLLSLNFHAFARVVAHLLERTGYEQVRLAGRTDWKGHNGKAGASGYDLLAVLPAGPLGGRDSAPSRRRVIAQLKQFGPDQSVYQRNVDELRGVALRSGAAEALLVTTGRFSPAVRAGQVQAAPLIPVRLVGGDELLDLLIARRVGVRVGSAGNNGNAGNAALEVDAAWFDGLERDSDGNGRNDCRGGCTPEAEPAPPRFLVRVAVEPLIGRRSRLRTRQEDSRARTVGPAVMTVITPGTSAVSGPRPMRRRPGRFGQPGRPGRGAVPSRD